MLTLQVLPRRGVVLRSALSTVETMVALVAAHVWAGGQLPSGWWMAAVAGLVFVVGLAVLRGRVPLRVAVPGLVAAQLLLHCWMTVLGSASHLHHDQGVALGLTWSMLLAHVVGGVVTALVWELRRRAVDVLLSWAEAGLVPPPTLRRVLLRVPPVLPLRRPLVVVPLRGPPVAIA